MTDYDNLKYARRAGSDVTLVAAVRSAGDLESRGDLVMRRMEVTDGHMTLPLVVFGRAAEQKYRAGQRLRAGPVYWSDQWQSFTLVRGGIVSAS